MRSFRGDFWKQLKNAYEWVLKYASWPLERQQNAVQNNQFIPQLAGANLAPVGWFPQARGDLPPIEHVWERLRNDGREDAQAFYEVLYGSLQIIQGEQIDIRAPEYEGQEPEVRRRREALLSRLFLQFYGTENPDPAASADPDDLLNRAFRGRLGAGEDVARRRELARQAREVSTWRACSGRSPPRSTRPLLLLLRRFAPGSSRRLRTLAA